MIKYEIKDKFLEMAKKGIENLNSIWPITQNITFIYCGGRSNNGWCKKELGNYIIALNRNLVKPEDILEVVMHEILHSYDEAWDDGVHSGEWLRRAQIVNQKFKMNIKRCNNFQKTGYKYKFRCTGCGKFYYFWQKPRWYSRMAEVTCGKCKAHIIEEEVN